MNEVRKFYLISYKFPGWYPGTNKHLKLRLYLLNVLENIYNAIGDYRKLYEILMSEMFSITDRCMVCTRCTLYVECFSQIYMQLLPS